MTVLPGFIDTPQTYSLQSRLTASREYVVQSILRGIEKRRNILYVPGFLAVYYACYLCYT